MPGRPTRDDANLLALEGVVVAALLFGAVMFLMASGDPPGVGVSTREEISRLTDDAVRVLARVPVEDERYDDSYLDFAVAAGLSGDPSYLNVKLKRLLPVAAQYNVYLDNGYRTDVIAGGRTPTGERVSSATAFAPSWSPAFVSTDFALYSDAAGTPMRVTAWPVYHGRQLVDDPYVPGGDMETDADGDDVPDGWVEDAAAAGALETDGSKVWRLDAAAPGRVAYADDVFPADSGTGIAVDARVKGARSCLQLAYLDVDRDPVAVGGVTEECVASMAAASPAAYEALSADVFLADSDVAFVRVELVLLEAGTAWFDDVDARPLARATSDGTELALTRSGVSSYGGSWSAGGYATGDPETLSVDARWRGQAITGDVTYATSSATLLPVAWPDAVAGLDASTFTASASQVRVGESVAFDFDFAPYEAALAASGVTLLSPQVEVRLYGPVVSPWGNVTHLDTLAATAGTLTGSVTYTHPEAGLYGPLFAEAALTSGWAKAGHTDVTGQEARKPLVIEAVKRDGASAIPPLYRVVVETWFPEW